MDFFKLCPERLDNLMAYSSKHIMFSSTDTTYETLWGGPSDRDKYTAFLELGIRATLAHVMERE